MNHNTRAQQPGIAALALAVVVLLGCPPSPARQTTQNHPQSAGEHMEPNIMTDPNNPTIKNGDAGKTEAEWCDGLSSRQFCVLRRKGTEQPYTSPYLNNSEEGIYRCAGCGSALFASGAKYDSGSGWPSYFQPVSPESLRTEPDTSHDMVRTEVLCAQCGGHLGHVFEDGPEPTGLRYCINGVALEFEPATEENAK